MDLPLVENNVSMMKRHSHKRVTSLESQTTTASVDDGSLTESEDDGDGCEELFECEVDVSPTSLDVPVPRHFVLPEGDDPPVKNTFIHFSTRSESFDECFAIRRTRSAPGSFDITPHVVTSVAVPKNQTESRKPRVANTGSRRVPMTPAMVAALGTPMLPTVGSAGHFYKKCKPCAFAWKDGGCQGGVECMFCHLCDSDEKKRRRKTKLDQRRNRRDKVQMTTAIPLSLSLVL